MQNTFIYIYLLKKYEPITFANQFLTPHFRNVRTARYLPILRVSYQIEPSCYSSDRPSAFCLSITTYYPLFLLFIFKKKRFQSSKAHNTYLSICHNNSSDLRILRFWCKLYSAPSVVGRILMTYYSMLHVFR